MHFSCHYVSAENDGIVTHIRVRYSTRLTWFNRQSTKTTHGARQMETFSALLALCAGNSPVTGDVTDVTVICEKHGMADDFSLRWYSPYFNDSLSYWQCEPPRGFKWTKSCLSGRFWPNKIVDNYDAVTSSIAWNIGYCDVILTTSSRATCN